MTEITTGDEFAITERGKKITHTKAEVHRALELNALCGGQSKLAAKMLDEEKIPVSYNKLKNWVKQQFSHEYLRVRKEVSQSTVGEKIAGDAMELANAFSEAEWRLFEELMKKADKIAPDKLAASIQQMAMAKDRHVENSRLLRNEPTEIVEERSVPEMMREMENLGIARGPKFVEVEAEVID